MHKEVFLKLKYFLPILLIFTLSGCRFFWEPVYISQKTAPNPAEKRQTKSAIKGIIKDIVYKNSMYCYTITATDTSNLKLKNANFCVSKYYHNKGDLVYATFIDNKLDSMLLISEKKQTNKTIYRKKTIKTKIPPPKEIDIKFD